MAKKILVVRFSSIGDIVLTTPIVRCLRQQLGAEVHVITKKSFADIYRQNPHVTSVLAIDKEVSEVEQHLKNERYDFIIDLHNNLRSFQVKRMCRKAICYSFPKLNVEKWLFVKLRVGKLPNVHIVDRYFETVKSLGVINDGLGLDYFIPQKDVVQISSLPENFQKGYVALTPGAKFATKEMPVDKIVAVIKRLNRPVVLLGGPDEKQKGEAIASACGDLTLNACGKYNLNQSASLLQQAEYVIAHDTGMMHIAAAFGKKILSVWGNTVPQFGMYPYLPGEGSRIIEVAGLSCRPCSKIGFDKCPKGHFRCMNDIPLAAFD